jgi:thioredoxin-related protein
MPLVLNAQNINAGKYQNAGPGIAWLDAANWEEVKAIARQENKYIFVDCYATWCQPCKLMDKEVYDNEQVGDFLNKKFVSIKLQMDTTKNDDDRIKGWYQDVDQMAKEYKISAYPSFLFFSPDGIVVHKQTGYRQVKDFISLSAEALDTQKQYYTLLGRYKENRLDLSEKEFLARMCRSLGEKDLALQIANDYIGKMGSKILESAEDKKFLLEFRKSVNAVRIANTYINSLTDEEMYKKENIELMTSFMESTKDKSFVFFYNHKMQIDSVMKKQGYAVRLIDFVIDKEEISPYWEAAVNEKGIDWGKINKSIKSKYSKDYANRIILNSKIILYKYLAGKNEKYWKDYLRYAIKKIENYRSDTTDFWQENDLNVVAWYTFLHSNDKKQLSAAISWMKAVTERHPTSDAYLDTYANLLYKAGRKQEAIAIEERVYEKSKNEGFKETLIKMKNDEATWTTVQN